MSSQITNRDLFQISITTPLFLLCNGTEICLDCIDPTAGYLRLLILQSVYELSVALENDKCSDAISKFYCNALNTVNNDASHDLITECLEVRDDTCAAEWRMVESFLDFTLPSCNNFYGSENFTSEKAPALNCPPDFGVFCGSLCQPLCDEFSLFSEAATVAYKVLNIMFDVMAIIAGVITILACCMHKEKMYVNV